MESKKYWKSIDELNRTSEFLSESSKEFGQQVPVDEVVNNTFDLSSGSYLRQAFRKLSPSFDRFPGNSGP